MSRKKILFFTKINFANKQNEGYLSKVRAQSSALRFHGFDVDLLYFRDNICYIENDYKTNEEHFNSRLDLLLFLFIKFPLKLKKGYYSGIYIRHFLTNPLFLITLMLHKMNGSTIVMEVPTFPYSFEYKGFNKNKILFWIDQISSLFFRFFISRIVTFSFDDKIFGIHTIKTDNGVEVGNIAFSEKIPPLDHEIHLLGLGNPRIWHAYERILKGMAEYYKNNNEIVVVFNMVGAGGELPRYLDLVNRLNLEKYIKFHGFQTGPALDSICESCHIAVASLGMHRINVSKGEASPLKAREFTARGLPFITGYFDKGFPEDFPFLINFPSDESPVDINKTLRFYLNLRQSHPHFKSEMRSFAEQNLDWKSKMKPIADFFQNK